RGQSFGQVSNAFIRIVNQADGTELARYDLSEEPSSETAMIFGEVYRYNGEWKFRAVGQGYASGLRPIPLLLHQVRAAQLDLRMRSEDRAS
ncbi:TerD family protein, partial [Streptomyces inhibens]|uniref:TerD family protein n=1 Tax=Streptomyces inhibens TaxID=2293571 RepID=UPI0037B80B6B